MQLLPRIGLHWLVVIEGLHAVTYACGWSGGQGRVGSMQGGGHNGCGLQSWAIQLARPPTWTPYLHFSLSFAAASAVNSSKIAPPGLESTTQVELRH